jgi:hypothetical protein
MRDSPFRSRDEGQRTRLDPVDHAGNTGVVSPGAPTPQSPLGRKADTVVAQCREALSDEAFARAWEEGVALDANAAADWALQLWEKTE